MIKRLTSILLVTLVFAVADEYLVHVDLNEDRLAPLSEQGFKILGELEHTAIVLLTDAEFDKIAAFSHQILDHQPQEGNYYFVRPFDSTLDISPFGEVLIRDGEDYLIKIQEGMLESLMKHKVHLKRLSFTPMVIRGETFLPPLFFNYMVQEMVDSVNADSLLTTVQRLQDFVTRRSTHDSCFAAANYIFDKFTAYGLDSVFFQYHNAGHAPNVIGIKRGTVHPESIYTIICGHFDSFAYSSPNIAPGADDNASGTAAVIEAARVMYDYEFEYSIRYIAFSGEEYGMYGSEHYAQLARAQGDSILGVFNGDMLSYVDYQPESLDVFAKPANPNCSPFADFFIAAADTYTTLRTKKHLSTSMVYSDHSPFWDQGYLALCNIDDFPVTNSFIHTPGDTIGAGYNDNPFHTEATRAEIAALALLASPVGTGVAEYPKTTPQITRLTVHPNISNTYFTINLTANEAAGSIYLKIFDATGRMVKNILPRSSVIADRLSATWDGTDNAGRKLPEGIYFLELGDTRSTPPVKLILLR
ncbi:M28 family peptidase [candidate division WOR-3 bacterium]|nr:M28 family peptidase [candidate division WOR-3 bacterium]